MFHCAVAEFSKICAPVQGANADENFLANEPFFANLVLAGSSLPNTANEPLLRSHLR
jgi:hypothetical protein